MSKAKAPIPSAQHELSHQINTFCQQVQQWKSRFPSQVEAIDELRQGFAAKIERLDSNKIKLNIGIMGQVKAGKSSFLNALLFDGNQVLPVASTPKTANLTRISYGDAPRLIVTFYSQQEWQAITVQAQSGGEHSQARVGRELLNMAGNAQLDVNAILNEQRRVISAESVDGLMSQLNDYVGENGRFTAMVKATDIELPRDELKGFEVVDTPGMNDPVPSRTQKTREYMAQCDVVFFLSRASQFLGASDMELLASQIPGNGVKRMVLVAGQMDAAILDDGFDRPSLKATEENLQTRLSKNSAKLMENLAIVKEVSGDTQVARLLREIKTPIFASTFAYGFATWPAVQWSENMQHSHKELQELAKESWKGSKFTQTDWERIGNFSSLREAYHAARQDKEIILQSQRDELIPQTKRELQARARRLLDAATQRHQRVRDNDMERIDAQIDACEANIDSLVSNLGRVIEQYLEKCTTTERSARSEINQEAKDASKVNARKDVATRKESYTVTVSASKLWNPFTWFSTREETHYRTITEEYEYIAAADVIEKLVIYGKESVSLLESEFKRVVDMAGLRVSLKKALFTSLDVDAKGFDPAAFRSIMEGTLERLYMPTLKIRLPDYASNISARFFGQIKGSQMSDLRQSQERAVESIRSELLDQLSKAVEELRTALTQLRHSLAKELTEDMEKERKQLQSAFANTELELSTYSKIIQTCHTYAY